MLRRSSRPPFQRVVNGFGMPWALSVGVFDMAAAKPSTAAVSPVMAACWPESSGASGGVVTRPDASEWNSCSLAPSCGCWSSSWPIVAMFCC